MPAKQSNESKIINFDFFKPRTVKKIETIQIDEKNIRDISAQNKNANQNIKTTIVMDKNMDI